MVRNNSVDMYAKYGSGRYYGWEYSLVDMYAKCSQMFG